MRPGLPLFTLASLAILHHPVKAAAQEDRIVALFQQHCVRCHGEDGRVKGKLDLLQIRSAGDLAADLDRLQDIIEVLEFEEMPPEDEPPLASGDHRFLIDSLQGLLHQSLEARSTYPPTPIRRMNRFQYNNAVQDLFDLKVQVFSLPERMLREHGDYFNPASRQMPDELRAGSRPLGKSQMIEPRLHGVSPFPQDLRAEHGFDNRADHLSLSPMLLESFLELAHSIVHAPNFGPETVGRWDEIFAEPESGTPHAEALRRRLEHLLTRSFRRPASTSDVERYAAFVEARVAEGATFTEAMKGATAAILCSPKFLYFHENAASAPVAPVDDFELATRLALFLWGGLPDDRLLELARHQKLSDSTVLLAEVKRMMDDRRTKRFCDSFPTQWLQLERIIASAPAPDRNPGFYFNLNYRASMHMMLEPLLLFETVFVEDRSILDLIDPGFSYRTRYLESWYEQSGFIPTRGRSLKALDFRRVTLDSRREGGIITNAAVMTMTSGRLRTHPITRGAWMTTVVFNNPPEPPPADIPALPEDEKEAVGDGLTLRQKLEAHRNRPDCAGCHARIDPLGFALENYGPTGIWRDQYDNGLPVDMSGELFRTHSFDSIEAFKDAILAEKDRFTRALAGHLLSYALGRELSPADAPALDRIVAATAAADYRFRPLLEQIILSEPFLHKSTPAGPAS